MNKEFLYVGYYVDTEGNTILKIGTTNNLKRRQQEHTRNYKRAKEYTMPKMKILPLFGICRWVNIILCDMRIKIARNGKIWKSAPSSETTDSNSKMA